MHADGWSHRMNMTDESVHYTQCSVRVEGADPGQSTGFPYPLQYIPGNCIHRGGTTCT